MSKLIAKSSVNVSTTQYVFSHGHLPRGRGLWIFQAWRSGETVFEGTGLYGEVKAKAIEAATVRGIYDLVAAP